MLDYSTIILYNYIQIERYRRLIIWLILEQLKKLQNNDGLTLKGGKCITYKSGYQVATEGIETTDPQEAIKAVRAYGGNCGVWFENGIYYIDKSHRVTTKKDALQLGREKNQISILQWRTMKLIYC